MMKLPKGCKRDLKKKIFCDINGKQIEMTHCNYRLGQGSTCFDTKGERHAMRDVIFPINMSPENRVDQKAFRYVNIGNKEIRAEEKPMYHAGYLSDLGDEGDRVELVNPHRDLVFLRLKFTKDKVIGIDPAGTIRPLAFDKNTEVYYEPWFMDVGSFVFINPKETEISGDMLKIATEGDIMREWK